ncbi:serine/threonine-protein kinase [Myxococcus landrumensis]|uniref:Serine/threonine protein kinase n=1 Tax=Myxococcus landrumensis TaxID=2813577 RepID=A0ABX7MXJ9_9BACT|nr:serine/threonine-protein kinase [Myxococcus landrumus]QSQ10933.1 serine/threonine protein kinase [Myxococcus landrumus]
MSPSRKCPRCGVKHRQGVTVCPKEVFRADVVASGGPYRAGDVEEDTDGDTHKSERGALQPPANPKPAAPNAPIVNAARMLKWEESVTRDMLVGTKVGDYVLKRRIGSGGMGIVYEGEHALIGQRVAIKVLRPDVVEGRRARDLATEARAASAIRHRGIIDIFGFGAIPDVGQYLVMEYLEGTPLDEVIHQRAPLPDSEVLRILDALLSALGAAHAAGVIHRDLKPGNVYIVRDEDGAEAVKVLDFGIAKRSEAPHGSTPQTHANSMVGTPEYIAPEQALGQQVSPQTDLYSVGIIAYEMLTRRLPFDGSSPMAIVVQHVRTPPPRPSTFVELNPALEALVLRLLAKEPSQRPTSAEAVRRELKLILASLTEGVTRLSPVKAEARHPSEETQVMPPRQGLRERRGKDGRRGARPGAVVPGSWTATPTMLLEQTTFDAPSSRLARPRKWWWAVGMAALLVMVGGWAVLAS